MSEKIDKILEKVLNENDDAKSVIKNWLIKTVKESIPGLEADNWGDVNLKGSKDPISGKPLMVLYYSTTSNRIILKIPLLNLGTTGSHSSDAEIKVDAEKLSDPAYAKDIEQKLKVHFVKWSKFYTKFVSLYKDLDAFKHV